MDNIENLYNLKIKTKQDIAKLEEVIENQDTEHHQYLMNQLKFELANITRKLYKENKINLKLFSKRLLDEAFREMLLITVIKDDEMEKYLKREVKMNKDMRDIVREALDKKRMEELEMNAVWIMDPDDDCRMTFEQCCDFCGTKANSIRKMFKKVWKSTFNDKLDYFCKYRSYAEYAKTFIESHSHAV